MSRPSQFLKPCMVDWYVCKQLQPRWTIACLGCTSQNNQCRNTRNSGRQAKLKFFQGMHMTVGSSGVINNSPVLLFACERKLWCMERFNWRRYCWVPPRIKIFFRIWTAFNYQIDIRTEAYSSVLRTPFVLPPWMIRLGGIESLLCLQTAVAVSRVQPLWQCDKPRPQESSASIILYKLVPCLNSHERWCKP